MSEIIASTYEIIGKLGSGGGGVVYLANHLRLDKRVVLKADKRAANTRAVLLRREVDVLKELRHTYIPQVYDYFIEDGVSYTVMDFVDGESLDKQLRNKKKFSQAEVIRWAKQVLMALSYLHSPTHGDPPRGYIHSDIKPANIMLRPNGDICLIDFNISLAMGMENVIGKSVGYSSPEYYGFDTMEAQAPELSPSAEKAADDDATMVQDKGAAKATDDDVTMAADDELTIVQEKKSDAAVSGVTSSTYSSSVRKVIVPDARSDIYSVGATLYHLLSGQRPARNADDVIPLSHKEFSPRLVEIITKAMTPDPAKRFSSADEMLEAFNNLRKNDPRVKRQKRILKIASALIAVCLLFSGLVIFTGMRQMERLQAAYVLSADSAEALAGGQPDKAVALAMDALKKDPGIFDIPYTADAQLALTNALGVYDLSDKFKPYSVIELPASPFRIVKSPDGSRAAVMYAYELAIYDIASGECITVLPTLESAMSEAEFLSNDVIIYSGNDGLTAYNIPSENVLWKAEKATSISVSADRTTAAAIYKKDSSVKFYDTASGELISLRELDGRYSDVPENDRFADAGGTVLEMSPDGSMCAVSLNDGGLWVLDIFDIHNDLIIYESSDYSYFNGVFKDNYFAFSAAGAPGSVFGMVDCAAAEFVGEMEGNSVFDIMLYDNEIYISQNDTAVMIDTDTFEQIEVAYTENKNIIDMDFSDKFIISATDDGYSVFSRAAFILQSEIREDAPDFVLMTDSYILLAGRDSDKIEILRFEERNDAAIIEYDPRIIHSEARMSADLSSVMLFDISGFTIIDTDGNTIAAELPDSDKIYDQQYRHDGDYLEVMYYSGKTVCYSALTGEMISEKMSEIPDDSLDEEFETTDYIISSPLHGVPEVFVKSTGEKLTELNSDDYLTYVTELGDYIIAQYISTDGMQYGVLMNRSCETIAMLPYLCDICGDRLYFDFPSGSIKSSPVYSLEELKTRALS